jgi:hypothetical protein
MGATTDFMLRASSAAAAGGRLLRPAGGTMIGAMSPLRRVVRAAVVALATALASQPALAQDDGWFDQPASPPAPAAAAASGSNQQPLAPSPLLDQDAPAASPEDEALDRDPRALTYWNGHLDPYGAWVEDPSYGRVWVPHSRVVGSDFAPYVSGGRWALDENDDWIWVSDYAFGGVVFHYGRWVWISGRGWAWIPGLRYAPAWVAWRTPVGGYGYVGWAPLPPAWVWFGGVSVVYGYGPYYPWVFCSSDYLFYPHVHHHIIRDRYRMTYAANHTRPYHRTASARPVAVPRTPTFREANVPQRSIPRERVRGTRLAAPAAVRGKADVLGSRIPQGQRAGSAPPHRVGERSPLLRNERAPADRRDVVPSERRVPTERRDAPRTERRERAPTERRDVAPPERRAPRIDPPRPSRERAPTFQRERPRVDSPRHSPGRELRTAPRGRRTP